MDWEDFFMEHTPIEKYKVKDRIVYVKRDDLFGRHPAPPLAKLRGIKPILERLNEKGVKVVGINDTRVSKAGQGLAILAKQLDMKAILGYPNYRSGEIPPQHKIAQEYGAEIYPVRANRVNIMYYQTKKYVESKGGYMLPKALITMDTVKNVAREASTIPEDLLDGSMVICAGSGTITSGVICGLKKIPDQFYVISIGMHKNKTQTILKLLWKYGKYYSIPKQVKILRYPKDYYDEEKFSCPFPSHPNYDRKAWRWLVENIDSLKEPVLFWNIGA